MSLEDLLWGENNRKWKMLMLSWTRVQKHFSLTETQATYNESSARNNGDWWSQCQRESLRNTPKDFSRRSPIQLLTRPTGLNIGEKIGCGVFLCAKLMEIKCFPNNVLLFRVSQWVIEIKKKLVLPFPSLHWRPLRHCNCSEFCPLLLGVSLTHAVLSWPHSLYLRMLQLGRAGK